MGIDADSEPPATFHANVLGSETSLVISTTRSWGKPLATTPDGVSVRSTSVKVHVTVELVHANSLSGGLPS
jgi:hypothetical protein